ncbi:MAG: hypothetical protein IKX06_05890 [Clostridia bacterium]|nr:hypothetical protein [Clostridia bacterium]
MTRDDMTMTAGEAKRFSALFSIPGRMTVPEAYRGRGGLRENAFSCDVSAFTAETDLSKLFCKSLSREDRVFSARQDGGYVNVFFRDAFLAENILRLAAEACEEAYLRTLAEGGAFSFDKGNDSGKTAGQGTVKRPDEPGDFLFFYTVSKGLSARYEACAATGAVADALKEYPALRCASVMMLFCEEVSKELAGAGIVLKESDFSAKLPELLHFSERYEGVRRDVLDTVYRAASAFLLRTAAET